MNYIRHLNAFFSYVKTDNRLTSSHVSLYIALFYYWNEARFKNPVSVTREKLMQFSKIKSKNNYYNSLKELHQAGYIFCHLKESKFNKVKISMVKFGQIEPKNNQQLNVFEQENNPPPCPINKTVNDEDPCLKNDTAPVLKIRQYCLNYRTATVLKIGHLYKPNIYKEVNSVCKTPAKIIEKNMKILNAINSFARVPNSVPKQKPIIPLSAGEGSAIRQPLKSEVETFFRENNYSILEAQKFFYYNNSKGWMLTDKIPIKDWQSLAHKWMLNENQIGKSKENTNYQTKNEKNYSEPL